MKKVHFIAIGGSAMHNLAIALYKKGYNISGSDDEIFEPSKSRLEKYHLLPASQGWDDSLITKDLDAVILGMHARIDNPELIKAQQLGIKIFSYPEYLYEQSKDKIRIVIGGSHGKTTITSMILHVFNHCSIETDYMVGAQLEGFDVMVKLTDNAAYTILEGDEYLTSPIDNRPKFHLYKPHIAVISGIAWDHINVFPQFSLYVEQFRIFADLIETNGKIIYYEQDEDLKKIAKEIRTDIKKIPYLSYPYQLENGITQVLYNGNLFPLNIFGEHNLANLNAARLVSNEVGISDEKFFEAIMSFKGASKRLELLGKKDNSLVYKDFAHAPSKLKATINAVRTQYPKNKLIACLELHTFSSLNKNFLPEFNNTMNEADEAYVYFNPHTLEHKKLSPISIEEINNAFNHKNLMVLNNSNQLSEIILSKPYENTSLLIMSSGNFDGLDLNELTTNFLR